MLIALWRSGASGPRAMWLVLGLAALFDVTVCWMPGLVSGDAILYATSVVWQACITSTHMYLQLQRLDIYRSADVTWWWFVPTP